MKGTKSVTTITIILMIIMVLLLVGALTLDVDITKIPVFSSLFG